MTKDPSDLATDSLRGGTSLFVGVGIATVVSGIGSILIGRLLGPGDYALYSLALILPTILFSLTIFGIDAALVRYIPRLRMQGKENEATGVLKAGLILRIVIACVLAIIGYFGSDVFADIVIHRPSLAPLIQTSSFAILFEALLWVSFYSLQGLDRMSWSGLTRTTHAILKAVISVGLIILGFGVLGGIIGFVASYVLSGIVSIFLLIWNSRSLREYIDESVSVIQMAKRILSFGLPLYVVTIIASLMIQYRLILLATFTSDFEIGNFNAAVNIATILIGVTAPLLMVLLPAFSKLSATERGEIWGVAFSSGQRYVSFFVLPCISLFVILSDSIVYLLYGTEYTSASLYLIWFSTVLLVLTIGSGFLESFLIGLGENILTLSFWSVFFVLFLPLGWLFVSSYGIIGMIFAELVSRLIAYLYGYWKGKTKYGIWIDGQGIMRVLAAAGLAGVLTFVIQSIINLSYLLELIICMLVYITLYMTFLPLTRAIRHTDLDLLHTAFSEIRGVRIIANSGIQYERFLLNRFGHEQAT